MSSHKVSFTDNRVLRQREIFVDPSHVDLPLFPSREINEFKHNHYSRLKKSIARTGNTTPVKVQPENQEGRYRLISGQLRLTACKELQIPLLAIVESFAVSEREEFVLTYRDNNQSRRLCPYINAVRCGMAIEQHVFKNPSDLAEAIGLDASNVHKYLQLFALEKKGVLRAFPDQSQIKQTWILPLHKRYQSDRDAMMQVVEDVMAAPELHSAEEVYIALLGKSDTESPSQDIILSSPENVPYLIWRETGKKSNLAIHTSLTDGGKEKLKSELKEFFIARYPSVRFHPKYHPELDIDLS